MDLGQRLAVEVDKKLIGAAVALDSKPPDPPLPSEEIKRRLREKAELLAELEARRPKAEPAPVSAEVQSHLDTRPSGRITADGRKLAGLMSRAKKLQNIAEGAATRHGFAKAAAEEARRELSDYMILHGLA